MSKIGLLEGTRGDYNNSECSILPTDGVRELGGCNRDEATEESGARGTCSLVSGVEQTGMTPRISESQLTSNLFKGK